MTRFILAFLTLIAAAANAAPSAQLDRSRIELIAETTTPAAGKTLTLGIVITPNEGWHSYWQNPGDSGVETRADWTLPGGAAATPLRYPVPERFVVAGLTSFVYGHATTLLADIMVPATMKPGTTFPISVKVNWLVCDPSLCVPQAATLDLALTVGDGAPDAKSAPGFAKARAALPRLLPAAATYAVSNGQVVIAAAIPDVGHAKSAEFFPITEFVTDYGAPQTVTVAGGKLRIETKAGSAKPTGPLIGVLAVETGGTRSAWQINAQPGAVPAAGESLRVDDLYSDPGYFAAALLGAILGGLLLNIMPCVFPILSLKALSLARAGGSERETRMEAFAYTAGIVLTCVSLGALILGLRAAGSSIGWAFQLQDPRVIGFLLMLMTAIGLNFAGLFEVEIGGRGAGSALASKGGTSGAFWTGVLAAFVATPCTGPFMGAALGAAIALPPLAGLAVFAGLGLGLALPFLALGYIPPLRRVLPKPGAWMNRFRHILAVPMFLTALGLAWVLGRQAGVDGMILGLGGALLLGLALWWLGGVQRTGGRTLVPLLIALGALLAVIPIRTEPLSSAATTSTLLSEEPFSQTRLNALRAAKTPVFLYFTADWCLTCKVNERGALADASVAKAFKQAGIVTLVGDWTRGDPAITAFLDAQGRSGIPLYLFYHPDGTVETLPQLLTPGRLNRLASGNGAAA